MNHMNKRITRPLLLSALIVLFLFTGYGVSYAEKADVSKVVFSVE
jgi:hypothetical protein